MRTPTIHNSSRGFLNEPYITPRNMWRYTTMKKKEAPVECI